MCNRDQNTILLTGATGFLGSWLLKALLSETDFKIIVLKRSFSNVDRVKDELNNVNVKYYDIDKIELKTVFEENKIKGIIHCATNYGRNGACEEVLKSNLIFPVQIIELAIKHNVELFINTDSYFNKENMSYLYLQNYSLSKKSLLIWLKYFSQKIKIINLVLEHIYGPFDNKNKFVKTMIKDIAIKKMSEVNCTPGEQKRDFIYIKDACDAYIKILEYGFKNKFRFKNFDIGTGEAVSIRNFVTLIKNISKSSTNINFGALPYRDDEIMLSVADTVELENLDWKPKYSLKEGLTETIINEEQLKDNV